jgi:ABC-type lipoprotein release transport system permease subunit
MVGKIAPFSRFEWMIAWRYIRAKRAEGGVSIMTWISLIGVTLAVFALIAVLAVRSGFRADFVDTIVGANAHLTVRENFMETVTVTQGDQSVDVTRRIDTNLRRNCARSMASPAPHPLFAAKVWQRLARKAALCRSMASCRMICVTFRLF